MATKKTETKRTVRPAKIGNLRLGKSYTGVSEMVRDLSDTETADGFDGYKADRRLINCLTVLRCIKEVSQSELASRMGCGQSKISKMETSADSDLNFGDIVSYATALKLSLHIAFSPGRSNGPNHIRFHLSAIKRELDWLVKLAGDDRAIGDGVEAYAIETMQKMVDMIEESIDRLPHRSQPQAPVSVEAEGEQGQPIPLDPPVRFRKSKKAPVET